MGVRCDKIVGFSLDITDEWAGLNEVKKNKVLDIELPDFGYVGFNINADIKNKLTIIYDGISGEYCKLVYVLRDNREENSEELQEILDAINEVMKESPVSFSVTRKIKQFYRELFGYELNKSSRIHAEYINHFH